MVPSIYFQYFFVSFTGALYSLKLKADNDCPHMSDCLVQKLLINFKGELLTLQVFHEQNNVVLFKIRYRSSYLVVSKWSRTT